MSKRDSAMASAPLAFAAGTMLGSTAIAAGINSRQRCLRHYNTMSGILEQGSARASCARRDMTMAVDRTGSVLDLRNHTAARTAGDERLRRLTIGVLGNRQVYEGTSIVRYEQILFHGIRAAARTYDCNLLLACGVGPASAPFEGLPAWPLVLPQTNFVPVGPWNTSGLIAIPPFTDAQQRALEELLPEDHPIVFTCPQECYPSVGPANDVGIVRAFAHLIAHGHRRIAFIAADEHASGDGAERLAAYRSAVAAHGLWLDSSLVGYGGHNVHESYQAMW